MMIAAYVWNITELSASGGGEKAEFTVSLKEDAEKSETRSADDYIVRKDGEEFDTERYRTFYSFLVSANAEEFALGVPVPEGEPAAVVKYTDSYTDKTNTFEFYDDSVMRSLIVVNGESKYYCTKAYVNTLIENIKRVGTGEDYIKTW